MRQTVGVADLISAVVLGGIECASACVSNSSRIWETSHFCIWGTQVLIRAEDGHDKFLAAQARHHVVFPGGGLEGGCNHFQGMIAFGVAVAVVHRLEVVQIGHQKGGAFLPAAGGSEHLRRVFLKGASVEQAGQAVPVGEFLQRRVQFLEFSGLVSKCRPAIRCRPCGGQTIRRPRPSACCALRPRTRHDARRGVRRRGTGPAFRPAGRSTRRDRSRTGARPGRSPA